MIKCGLCEWALPLPGVSALRLASELGYDGVQILDFGGGSNNFPLNVPWVQHSLREAKACYGIEIQNLQLQDLVKTGFVKSPVTSAEGKAALRCVKKGAEACQAIGIPTMMVNSFFDSWIDNEEDFDRTADMLRESGKITSDAGVQLIYESFLGVEDTVRLWEQSDRSFKLCYDLLNPLRYHFGDPLKELRRYDLKLFDHIHVKDAPVGYQGACKLGTGAGMQREACAILSERGYDGWVICENLYCKDPIGKEDPCIAAEDDLRTISQWFSKVSHGTTTRS